MAQQYLTEAQLERLDQAGRWVFETCRIFGTTHSTAWKVAGLFVQGLEREWTKQAHERDLVSRPYVRTPLGNVRSEASKRAWANRTDRSAAGRKAAATRRSRKEATATNPA